METEKNVKEIEVDEPKVDKPNKPTEPQKVVKMKKDTVLVPISKDLVIAILNYLGQRPYREVAILINEIQTQVNKAP